jgi:tRNA G18 (ribose-2'-O)-methylase SpoU
MRIVAGNSSNDIDRFRNLRKQWPVQLKQGFFYAEGEQVFERLLESQLEIVSVLLTRELFEIHHEALQNNSCAVVLAEKSWIETTTMQKLNQGIIAFARIPEPFELVSFQSQNRFCVVALDGLDHAVNIGTIFRSCAAFGVDAVITTTLHPFSWRVVRASLGGVFQVPYLITSSIYDSLKFLKDVGTVLIAADPSSRSMLTQKKFGEKVCLILGNEHKGISSQVLKLDPQRIAIPMSRKIDSLNVSAASAIFLYEINSFERLQLRRDQKSKRSGVPPSAAESSD